MQAEDKHHNQESEYHLSVSPYGQIDLSKLVMPQSRINDNNYFKSAGMLRQNGALQFTEKLFNY